jgi:hypothetical protein
MTREQWRREEDRAKQSSESVQSPLRTKLYRGWLVSADGRPIARELSRRAGTPITVTGRLARDGDQFVLFEDGKS